MQHVGAARDGQQREQRNQQPRQRTGLAVIRIARCFAAHLRCSLAEISVKKRGGTNASAILKGLKSYRPLKREKRSEGARAPLPGASTRKIDRSAALVPWLVACSAGPRELTARPRVSCWLLRLAFVVAFEFPLSYRDLPFTFVSYLRS